MLCSALATRRKVCAPVGRTRERSASPSQARILSCTGSPITSQTCSSRFRISSGLGVEPLRVPTRWLRSLRMRLSTTASSRCSRDPKWCRSSVWETPTEDATSFRRIPSGPTVSSRCSVASRIIRRASSAGRRRTVFLFGASCVTRPAFLVAEAPAPPAAPRGGAFRPAGRA